MLKRYFHSSFDFAGKLIAETKEVEETVFVIHLPT